MWEKKVQKLTGLPEEICEKILKEMSFSSGVGSRGEKLY